jgi:hypothetical protein
MTTPYVGSGIGVRQETSETLRVPVRRGITERDVWIAVDAVGPKAAGPRSMRHASSSAAVAQHGPPT